VGADDRANILIVDDRPEQLFVLRTILEELGQNIITGSSGEIALKRVLAHDFAVILLDVNMPGIDGLETAALIRGRKKSAHIPIIFITADYHDPVHTARGYSLGAVDYIASPVVPEILRSKVKVFVDLHLYTRRERQRIEAQAALAEERAARALAERAERRAAFLAQATTALAQSLELEATMRHLVGLVVPALGDVAILYLSARDGESSKTMIAATDGEPASTVAVTPVDGIEDPWLAEIVESLDAAARGIAVNCPAGATTEGMQTLVHDGPIQLTRDRSAQSLVVVPLAASGKSLGVLAFGYTTRARTFDSETLSTAIDLSARASIALDNAVLFRRIQEEDRRKNEFLAMLAHELRNPLAPIGNALHILDADASGTPRSVWARNVIRRQFDLLVRLVDDLVDVSRITRGKIALRIEPVDVARVVETAIETCRPQIDSMRHAVDVKLPPAPLYLRGDFARIAQVIGNLLSNAAKYTEPGGRISISADREGDAVVLRVRDTGMGIPKDALFGIFELFTQLNRTIDRSKGGLGIGLTVVRRLVEMQGGTVIALSDGPDRGSEFVVRLTAADVMTTQHAGPDVVTAADQRAAPRFSVLVVDDNRDVAESTATLLEIAGHEVHIAYDGVSAINKAASVRPQLALIDIGLPGMDGYEVVRRLRRDPLHSGAWICALSGYDSPDDRERSASAGFDHHFVKPLDPARLSETLAALAATRTGSAAAPLSAAPQRPAAASGPH
jgi:signal transduction histidine kinase/DNA-binding response OmpR family regulator